MMNVRYVHRVPCSCNVVTHGDLSFSAKHGSDGCESDKIGLVLPGSGSAQFNGSRPLTVKPSDKTVTYDIFLGDSKLHPAIAATLCGPGCQAYTFLLEAAPLVQRAIDQRGVCNVLVTGDVALWAVALYSFVLPENCRLFVAHNNRLTTEEVFERCSGAVHWNPKSYEDDIIERTLQLVDGTGFDIVIEPSPLPRTLRRCFRLLGEQGGALLYGSQTCSKMVPDVAKELAKEGGNRVVLPVQSRLTQSSNARLDELCKILNNREIWIPPVDIYGYSEFAQVMEDLRNNEIGGSYVVFDNAEP